MEHAIWSIPDNIARDDNFSQGPIKTEPQHRKTKAGNLGSFFEYPFDFQRENQISRINDHFD